MWMNVANSSSVSLRGIADAAVAVAIAVRLGRLTVHRESAGSLSWCRTVKPSLVTCTALLVKVATHPLLHNSDMLISEVANFSSGNIWAVSGADKWGNQRSPVEEELMVWPFSNKTRIGLLWHTLLRCIVRLFRAVECVKIQFPHKGAATEVGPMKIRLLGVNKGYLSYGPKS